MIFQIREKIFSFGDDFKIKDSHGNDAFIVSGKVFSMGDKLRLYNTNGEELYYLEQKLLKFMPEFSIYSNSREVARIRKKVSFFGSKFIIDSDFGDYDIEGSIMSHNFDILKSGRPVANISKEFFSFSDTYGVDIHDGEDYAFILSLAIVVDQIIHDN